MRGGSATKTPNQVDAPTAPVRTRVGFWLVAAVYALVMLGGTLPIPLYVIWAPQMGFGPFTTTLVFATYALGTVLALLMFASLSDRAGRRPLLACALLAATAGTALFLAAPTVEILLAARFLCGVATGVCTATATAALRELAGARHVRRASVVSTAANMGGMGLGTIVAGLFAQFGTDPTHLVFWGYLAALFPAFIAVAVVPETVTARRPLTLTAHRPALPDRWAGRAEFLRAAVAVFAAFAVGGLFSSLVPSFLRERLHVQSVAALGGEVGLLFIVALIAQLTAPERRLATRWFAPAFLIGGVVVFETGLWTRSLPVFVIGTLLAGAGIGLTFRRGIAATQRLADPKRRADLLSTYFLAAYAGTIVPTLTLGFLAQAIDQDIATLLLTTGVVTITLTAAVDRRSRAPRSGRPDRPALIPVHPRSSHEGEPR